MKSSQLTWTQLFSMALAECRGAGRRFIFFVICLAIGVGAVMTIKSFTNILESAILRESKSLLAADVEIKSSWKTKKEDAALLKKVLPADSAFAFLKELHAMVRYSVKKSDGKKSSSLLVELKAVPINPANYPFYGKLKTNPSGTLPELLGNRGALVEPNFLIRTKLQIGDSFKLGSIQARITGVIEAEPDRISRAFSIGPRVMVSSKTLDGAKLIAPGSRVKHRTLIRLPDEMDPDLAIVLLKREKYKDKSASMRTYLDMQSSLTSSINRMGNYLGAVGVIALLMGGIGVAMIVRTFMAQKLDTIAILNCVGATSRTIFSIYLIQSILLGLAGSALGLLLGYGVQFLLPSKVSGLLSVSVEPVFSWQPALQSLLLGILITLLFAVWPLIRAVKTRPLRLFRHIAEEEELVRGSRRERWTAGLIFSLGLVSIIFWQAGSVQRGLVFLLALVISIGILSGVAVLGLKFLKRLPPSRKMTRRYGLANLFRPNNQAVSIITALGIGIMLVLSIRLVQMDMLSMLKKNTEINPPNYFFIDIQRDQTETFRRILDRIAPEAERDLIPLVRSRFYSIDDRSINNWKFKDKDREEWFIHREFVLTYMVDPPSENNSIVKGKWWSKDEASIPQVSLEEDAASRLGATLGSKLTMEIQGIKITAPVTSIRKVDWRNMRTNFYIIFSPGALKEAPVTYVSSVSVPKEKELMVQEAVVEALPNITALSTRDIINTVETVTGKLMTLVDFMSAFAIFSGLFILSGAVASTKFRRMKETAILKTLGAKRKVAAAILGYEYATLGTIAAIVGVVLSLAFSWAVMEYIVKSEWNLRLAPLAWSFILAVVLTTLTGLLSSLDVLRNKPVQTLRKIGS